MPTIEENLSCWNQKFDWTQQGNEWSAPWGGPESQWWAGLMPRIHAFVPCESILEIAPGYGRWTHYLKDLCSKLTLVDLSERCIDHCKQRFGSSSHIDYFVNDGKSLEMVADRSADFVFSFDSLVHAEADVLETYVHQLAKKLKPNGIGFIHHSNALRYRSYFSVTSRLPRGKHFLARNGLIINDCARALSMGADLFRQYCSDAGLECVGQEIINWDGKALVDCISMFTHKGSRWSRPNQIVENRSFVAQAHSFRQVSQLYCNLPDKSTAR